MTWGFFCCVARMSGAGVGLGAPLGGVLGRWWGKRVVMVDQPLHGGAR